MYSSEWLSIPMSTQAGSTAWDLNFLFLRDEVGGWGKVEIRAGRSKEEEKEEWD